MVLEQLGQLQPPAAVFGPAGGGEHGAGDVRGKLQGALIRCRLQAAPHVHPVHLDIMLQ